MWRVCYTMPMARRHYREDDGIAACGWIHVPMTEDVADVTCKLCQRKVAERLRREREGFRSSIGLAEALRSVAHLLGGPPVVPYPPLTPDGFRSMRCRFRRPCRCAWCRTDEVNAPILARWEAEAQLRPHRRYERPFGSVRAAILRLAHRSEGVSSSMGSALSRLRETSALGTHVQTTVRRDRDPLPIRRVDESVDVEHAIRWAYQEPAVRRGLSVGACVAVLVDSVREEPRRPEEWGEALGVSAESIRGVIRHGMRVVGAWLYLAGYVPEPRQTGTVDRVRAAMERGR